MEVMCQIVRSDEGFEGIVLSVSGQVIVYRTGFQPCAEDCEGLLEGAIIRNKWRAVPWATTSGPRP